MIRNNFKLRLKAFTLLLVFIFELAFPTLSYALTEGPSSPEFTSFEPVSTTDMVNVSSGDFVYNLPVVEIPGANGSGYAMSLSYHGDVNAEKEASWVGFGWTLNPGAINRGLSGVPDEYENNEIIKYNKSNPNWTVTRGYNGRLEKYSKDAIKKEKTDDKGGEVSVFDTNALAQFSVSANSTKRYSNNKGYSKFKGISANAMGMASIGASRSKGETTLNFSVSAGPLLGKALKSVAQKRAIKGKQNSFLAVTRALKNLTVNKLPLGNSELRLGAFGSSSFATNPMNTAVQRFRGVGYQRNFNVKIVPLIPVGIQVGFDNTFTTQSNLPKTSYLASGFLNSPDNIDNVGVTTFSDYHLERDRGIFSQRDNFLPIVFHSNDHFSLTGEGLSGGFRFYKKRIGHYFAPRQDVSNGNSGVPSADRINKTTMKRLGLELTGINPVGLGVSVGGNWNKVISSGWVDNSDIPSNYAFDNSDNFTRFDGDLGGELNYADNDDLHSAWFTQSGTNYLPGTRNFKPTLNGTANQEVPSSSAKRKGFIGQTALSAVNATNTFGSEYSYLNAHKINNVDADSEDDYNSSLAKFEVTKEDGNRYVYGLPVYNRNELSASVEYNVEYDDDGTISTNDGDIVTRSTFETNGGNFIENNRVVIGEEKTVPYSGTHLLTEILASNYYDVHNDGPTNDDVGGWTKFHYSQAYGAASDGISEEHRWYRWRMPYMGTEFNKNNLADTQDDMVSFSKGEKEVYYLKSVETNSHVAVFVTNKSVLSDFSDVLPDVDIADQNLINILNGSGVSRKDGLGTYNSDQSLSLDVDVYSSNANNYKQELQKLERIVVFAKNDQKKPLRVANFEYDYSLVKNLPNNEFGTWEGNITDLDEYSASGKLTLKKVWFDDGGVYKARTAPYRFGYEYFNHDESNAYPSHIAEMYPDINQHGSGLGSAQNPSYSPYGTNGWGVWDAFNNDRRKNMQSWLYQGDELETAYDPAAWHLKTIELPSGGQIHVQYEEGDYSLVHDKQVMALTSLKSHTIVSNILTCELNLGDIGLGSLETTQEQFTKQVQDINNAMLGDDKEKMYFKFLYSLNSNISPSINSLRSSDYVNGYTEITNVTSAWSNDPALRNIKIHISAGGDDNDSPVRAAYHKFMENYNAVGGDQFSGLGNHDELTEVIASNSTNYHNYSFDMSAMRSSIKSWRNNHLSSNPGSGFPEIGSVGDFSNEFSYVRIPLWKAKRGGSARVKRILSYDPGIADLNGEARLYGTEYFYETEQFESSGVASNEPAQLREENPFVQFMPRGKQTGYNKLVFGEDREESEGPLGEKLLPFPSIVYSRVVSSPISNNVVVDDIEYESPSGIGFKVDQFYTYYDFPFGHFDMVDENGVAKKTDFDPNHTILAGNKVKNDKISLPLGVFNLTVKKKFLAQGYRFYTNQMHGVAKSSHQYGGNYKHLDKAVLSQGIEYNYFRPGEKVKLMSYNSQAPIDESPYRIRYGNPGKVVENCYYMDQVRDISHDLNLEVDITMVWPIFKFGFSYSMSYDLQKSEISRHTSNKIISFPTILKSTKVFQDGLWNCSEHVAFDEETGNPVITKSYDGYDNLTLGTSPTPHNGAYYQTSIPSHWLYSELGQKATNQSVHQNILNMTSGSVVSYGDNADPTVTTESYSVQLENSVEMDWYNDPQGVFSASASLHTNNWYPAEITGNQELDNLMASSDYQTLFAGMDGGNLRTWLNTKRYQEKALVYDSEIVSANNTKITQGGLITNFEMYDWRQNESDNNNSWRQLDVTDAINFNGVPVTSHTELLEDGVSTNIYSAVHLSNDDRLPNLIGKNTGYTSMSFDDFEEVDVFNGFPLNLAEGHTGKHSFILESNGVSQNYSNSSIILNQQLVNDGGLIRAWLRTSSNSQVDAISISAGSNNYNVKIISRSGDWMLIEAYLNSFNGFSIGNTLPLTISYDPNISPAINPILLDDIRFGPADAVFNAYVYDPLTYRLVASIDDQNFAQIYQYNEEGQLIRKIVETENGIMTQQETQYNTPKSNRYD